MIRPEVSINETRHDKMWGHDW